MRVSPTQSCFGVCAALPEGAAVLALALVAAVLCGLRTHAQGAYQGHLFGSPPNPVGSGARAMGQGNAFIAVADDATAASWSPAGLTHLVKPELSLAFEWAGHRERRGSSRHPEVVSTDSGDMADLNYLSVVMPFLWKRHGVFSLSYLNLYSFDRDGAFGLDPEGMVGHSEYEFSQSGSFAVIAPSLAVDATQRLSLGVSLNLWHDSLTGSSSYRQGTDVAGTVDIGGIPQNYAAQTRDSYTVDSGYSLTLGARYRLTRHWTVGVVYKPECELDLRHRESYAVVQNGVPWAPPEEHDRPVLRLPSSVGAGIAWQSADAVTVSLDATWTDWSSYRRWENGQSVNPVTGRPEDPLSDTTTWRFGAEYLIVRDETVIPLRAGFAWDPAPGISGVDGHYSVHVGAGLQLDPVVLDIAYEFRWANDVRQNGLLGELGVSGDVQRHRVLASLIYYF